jgi:predicted unusual protein kinase regulating ubiquinone biosynthesis (AarF/ABC1/UbiB family)
MVETIKYNLFGTNIIKNLTYKLAKVNILCIKIFQAISLNINKSINDELIKYTDHVPYSIEDDIDIDNLMDLVSHEGLEIDVNKPIASGMISIVYKALVQNPKENEALYKIIKVKRKNIEQKLEESIKNMGFLIKVFLGFIYFLSYFNPDLQIIDLNISDVFNKNIDLINEQLDFNKEVENMKEMKESYKNNDYINIPEVFENVTKKYNGMILMEYIDGVSIEKVEEIEYEKYAKLLFTFSYSSLLIKGIIHGDLHPGNILFIKEKSEKREKGERGEKGEITNNDNNDNDNNEDNDFIYKIGIIDFGLVYKLDDDFKYKFSEIFIDVYSKPVIVVASNILICGIFEPIETIINLPEKHKKNIIQLMANKLDDIFYTNKKNGLVNIFDFMIKLKDYFNENNLKRYNIQMSKNFLKIQMVMAMNQGLGLILCKNNNIEMINSVIREMFHLDLID